MRDRCTLFLHNVLYALQIRWNLVSVLVLIKLVFNFNFHNNGVDLYLGTSYYGCRYFLNSFIIHNVDYGSFNVGYSLFVYSNSYDNDVNIWHARLCHIGQQRMNRSAKEGFLGNTEKVNLPTCKHCLEEK